MLDVRRMQLLRDLARLGTIAAVAQAQFCTPSAISQQLSALEREAGLPLIRRCGRGVELTAAGLELADRAGPVLALLEEAEAALATIRGELTGELRVGAFPTAVRSVLPAALVRLGSEYPRLELHLTELDPAAVPDALRSEALDVALVHEYDYVPAEPDSALATEPLLEETIFLAAADTASAGAGAAGASDGRSAGAGAGAGGAGAAGAGGTGGGYDPVRASRALPWIVASPGTLCHLMTVRLCQAAGFTPRIRHYADDFAAVLALVAAGQGVAVVPELALADRPSGVALAPLPAHRRTLIACRRGAAAHPAVAACTAALRAATADYLERTATIGA
jgi:DNA-binding transcriptional LysR family regulator